MLILGIWKFAIDDLSAPHIGQNMGKFSLNLKSGGLAIWSINSFLPNIYKNIYIHLNWQFWFVQRILFWVCYQPKTLILEEPSSPWQMFVCESCRYSIQSDCDLILQKLQALDINVLSKPPDISMDTVARTVSNDMQNRTKNEIHSASSKTNSTKYWYVLSIWMILL